ncbi:hypothetical protein D9M69_700920 [compost metagenome]
MDDACRVEMMGLDQQRASAAPAILLLDANADVIDKGKFHHRTFRASQRGRSKTPGPGRNWRGNVIVILHSVTL